jgi:predicted aconitase with swiveling domain
VSEKLNAVGVNIRNPRKSVSGKAIVFSEPVDLETQINPRTGKVISAGHVHEGLSVKNKIMVAPKFAFNPELEFLVFLFASSEVAPKGIIVDRVSSNLILGAVMADIPIIYGFQEPINDFIRTGDNVTINIVEKTITIKKPGAGK